MDYVILGFLLAVMWFIMILGQWVQKERKYKQEIKQLKAEISVAEDRIRSYQQKLLEYASQQELLLDYKKMYADEVQRRVEFAKLMKV